MFVFGLELLYTVCVFCITICVFMDFAYLCVCLCVSVSVYVFASIRVCVCEAVLQMASLW